ncbi:sensor histidine kinase [Bordetella trematum]|uniref:sensor histidine kinase n=1 Tax=Bordetella trematum TaxID=123899 RepID=UPI003989758E
MKLENPPTPSRSLRAMRLTIMVAAMAAIFICDTTTSYEVAVSVFYIVVILMVARVLSRRGLVILTGVCIGITLLSFAMTPHGEFHVGLVNMGISIVSIVITCGLVLKMEAARAAAHEAQARLLRIARAKSLESLTTSIAHEVNQPLAAIVTSGSACQRWMAQQPPNMEKARQALQRIQDDAERASHIIARVRSLTKGEPLQRTVFDFNEAVREIVTLSLEDMARADIALSAELAAGLPAALADRVQIQQVIGNLVLNAIEANLDVAPARRSLHIASRWRDGMLELEVADTGVGWPQGLSPQLFEAFWTTKEEGIGVGLSISRSIVEANGGQIWAQANSPGGAVFRFSLPANVKEPA